MTVPTSEHSNVELIPGTEVLLHSNRRLSQTGLLERYPLPAPSDQPDDPLVWPLTHQNRIMSHLLTPEKELESDVEINCDHQP
jgi:hypothetical protein